MADKKITALTEQTATGKAGEDFLHIIDYGGGSSPVNKKISLTNFFNNANLDTHIYGTSKTFEVGFTASSISALKVVTSSGATADGSVTINDDGVAYMDFLVKSLSSDSALSIDAGADTVTINGDSANLDFVVNGDNTAKMLFVDASADVLGVGVTAPATAYMLDVGEVGSGATGKSIQAAGGADIGGNSTITGSLGVTGDFNTSAEILKLTTTTIGVDGSLTTALAGGANGSEVAIPVDKLITHLNPADTTNAYYSLTSGAQGQLKFIMNITAHDVHIESATIGGASGTEIKLDANECCMLLYSGGSGGSAGWWNIGGGTAVA